METLEIPNAILLAEVSDCIAGGHEVVIRTKGSSMLPFIRGDRDSVLLYRKETVEVGDIVLAEISPGCYVLHRVFAVDGDRLTLMGDGNLRGRESCRICDVKGTVKEIIHPDGSRTVPGKGRFWRRLLPFRRIILGIYRRLI